ncbi:hypothetical protein BDF20DRAFT_911890 [Mycotypha africana]|uniref:uncharacterized protein n=1 Tax=Mycotypha africana TaxID=64632 RepID=UPI002301F91E|nr:uncharacterized protein BDF20DRAFT_911890 [Mycotypha africana]KAI8981617.1 hypothetical protein BDF20DRAFT_911890 [Mycotypha africana]
MTQNYDLPNFPLFNNLIQYATNTEQIAIDDSRIGRSFTYKELITAVIKLRHELLNGKSSLKEQRVLILCPSGFPYVVALLAVWAAGGIAVPLCTTHPLPEQIYTMQDSQSSLIVGHPLFGERISQLTSEITISVLIKDDSSFLNMLGGDDLLQQTQIMNDPVSFDAGNLIIYTSGTTGKPKGALSTHAITDARISVLVNAWYWTANDRIHHTLPLHHIHGIINALLCPLYIGATVEMFEKFDAAQVWGRWAANIDDNKQERPAMTVFMSVPTVYSKLIQHYKKQDVERQAQLTRSCKQFRLMVSGSASLPTTLRNQWRKISGGQVLLERYGMTEIGMALSQEYMISERVEGTVGFPLPGVQVRLISQETNQDVTEDRNEPGILQIKGCNIFKKYWEKPEATKKEFTEDGWFITGDVAQRLGCRGYYQIMGRKSVDIIKTGGEKVSALEVERELLSCDLGIQDVAVVGIPDPEWGQKVAAVVVMEDNKVSDV